MLRAFVALEISEPRVLDSIVSLQQELSRTGADLKLVERQNLHFTVKFLGEVSEAQAMEADARLKVLSLTGARVEVRGVGAFPSIARPNVLWVGVRHEDEDSVAPIAKAAIDALDGIGERDLRPFKAHATVARVRSGRNTSLLASFLTANSDRFLGETRLSELKLKSSTLKPQGPVYADIGVYLLA